MDHPDSRFDLENLAQMFEAFPQGDGPRLLRILYEETQRELPEKITALYFTHTLHYSDMTSKMHLNQLNCLVEFLQNGGDNQKVADFQTLAKDKLGDDWPLSEPDKEWKHIWRMIYMMLGFPKEPMHLYPTFSGMAETFFGRSGSRDPVPIEFLLDDLINIDLRIQPTDSPYEHLELSDGTVKVFRVSTTNLAMLVSFSTNKVAGALGIKSLGDEIFSSYSALMADYRDALDPAHYRVIMEPMDNLKHAAFCGMMGHRKGPVKLLSQRVIALQHEINSRKRWWNSFIRDLSKQSDVQRLIFYGAVLAVLFGILTVIQTICSVWSLVVSLK